jgi:hypothetical protein
LFDCGHHGQKGRLEDIDTVDLKVIDYTYPYSGGS